MALTFRPRPQQVEMYFDLAAALAWERKGLLARLLADSVNQQKAAYMRQQHRLWKAAGRPVPAAAQEGEFNPFLASHWLGKR